MVTLANDTWLDHVLDIVDGHPQMAGYEILVQEVLRDPYMVQQSTHYETAAAFISSAGVGPSPEGIRVVVAFDDVSYQKGASIGRVSTAYPVDVARYPTPRLGKTIYTNTKRK
jgi:hypothetical protein